MLYKSTVICRRSRLLPTAILSASFLLFVHHKPPNSDRLIIIFIHHILGLFNKNRKTKPSSAPKAQSRDSINTVFTTSSDGEAIRRKRLSTAGTAASAVSAAHLSYRKRDSKATTSSSGKPVEQLNSSSAFHALIWQFHCLFAEKC